MGRGATWHDDPGSAAAAAAVVIAMVGLPRDVEEIYFGGGGVVSQARPGTILIDMPTSRPSLAKLIASAPAGKRLRALDAPLAGGDIGAPDANASIMIGRAEARDAAAT